MPSRFTYAILIVFLAATVLFLIRQRTLNDLRARNDTLRQQLATQTSNPASDLAPSPSATNTTPELTPEERSELLRLRGQITSLRNELLATTNNPRR